MACLNKWFSATTDMMNSDDAINELESLPRSSRCKRDFVAKFSIRRLDASANVDQLKKGQKIYEDLPKGPLEQVAVFTTLLQYLKLSVQTLSAMIVHILIREVDEEIICEVEKSIKIFLTYFDSFDKCFGKNIILEIKENILEK